MPDFPADEIIATHDRYLAVRGQIERGEKAWSALADFFTEDATYIDPAWGRYEGKSAITAFLDDSMGGLEGWTFPHEFEMVQGNRLLTRWCNRLPGQRADGSHYDVPAYSYFIYAGDGLFSQSEDIFNMVHVNELIRESGWKPGPGLKIPPNPPRR